MWESKEYVIDGILTLFKYISIVGIKDMAGYHLGFIRLLLNTKSLIKVGSDSRQATYNTHFA